MPPDWQRRRPCRTAACSWSATRSSRSTGSGAPTSPRTCDAQQQIGDPVVLDTNFRTGAPVLHWINYVFGRLIVAGTARSRRTSRWPTTAPPRQVGPPVVVLLGVDPHTDQPNADELRTREAADVVAAVRTALAKRWQVAEELRLPDGRSEQRWRDVSLADIAILVPARTSLPHLEDALDEAGIRYHAEASSLVYRTREVRDLLTAARAVDDPSDALALVSRAALAAVRLRRRRPVDVVRRPAGGGTSSPQPGHRRRRPPGRGPR